MEEEGREEGNVAVAPIEPQSGMNHSVAPMESISTPSSKELSSVSTPSEEKKRGEVESVQRTNGDSAGRVEEQAVEVRPKKPTSKKTKSKRPPTTTTVTTATTTASTVESSRTVVNRRQLEMEAYAALIIAFRAQGELTWKKETLLHDLRQVLKISEERHRMEVLRAEKTLAGTEIRGKRDEQDSEQELSSDVEYSEGDSSRPRKKHKNSSGERDLHWTVQPLPNSENQPALVTSPPTKKKATKKRSSKGEGTLAPIPKEILEAQNSGDLERLKEVLQTHTEKLREELKNISEKE